MWGALIAAGLSYLGSRDSNKQNKNEAAKDRLFQHGEATRAMDFSSAEAVANRHWQDQQASRAMDFSAQEAARNRDFQADQSATQFTRASEDLQNAGLNRILALGSPAAASSGAQAQSAQGHGAQGTPSQGSGSRAATMQNNIAAGLNAASAYEQIENMKAQNQLIKAQAEKTDAETTALRHIEPAKELSGHVPRMINSILGQDASGAYGYERAREALTKKLQDTFGDYTPHDRIKDTYKEYRDKLQKKLKEPDPVWPTIKNIFKSQKRYD